MAPTNCYECGGKLSTRATACPHCGAPIDATLTQTRPAKQLPVKAVYELREIEASPAKQVPLSKHTSDNIATIFCNAVAIMLAGAAIYVVFYVFDQNMRQSDAPTPLETVFPRPSPNDRLQSRPNQVTSKQETYSPSFNCNKATTAQEHLICSSEELSQADVRLVQAYKAALAVAGNRDVFQFEQFEWRKNVRDICQDVQCLRTAYRDRTAELLSQTVSDKEAPISEVTRRGSADEPESNRQTNKLSTPNETQKPTVGTDTNPASSAAQTEGARKILEQAEQLMMRVEKVRGGIPYNFYINPSVWATRTLREKETFITALSTAKKTLYGEQVIHIYDGYTGEELGRTGITGPVVYK